MKNMRARARQKMMERFPKIYERYMKDLSEKEMISGRKMRKYSSFRRTKASSKQAIVRAELRFE